jgi:catechol 2,3-dioxygenase-like lactoylglutathione lyase family enzyme
MTLTATVLSSPDPVALADFYHRLLGWPVTTSDPGWVMLARPDGGPGLSFHADDGYVRPVWPSTAGEQQVMCHLDIEVADLASAREFALAQGAVVAEHQPQADVVVCLDPDGHPFCLYLP